MAAAEVMAVMVAAGMPIFPRKPVRHPHPMHLRPVLNAPSTMIRLTTDHTYSCRPMMNRQLQTGRTKPLPALLHMAARRMGRVMNDPELP